MSSSIMSCCDHGNEEVYEEDENDVPPTILHLRKQLNDEEVSLEKNIKLESTKQNEMGLNLTTNEQRGDCIQTPYLSCVESKTKGAEENATLMEIMMAEAEKAHEKEKKKRIQNERKDASTSALSARKSGLKKGFLNEKRNKTKKRSENDIMGGFKENTSSAQKVEDKSIIYELDEHGNLIKPEPLDHPKPDLSCALEASSSSRISARPNDSQLRSKKDNLILEEVQEAMKNNSLNLGENVNEWATPDLLETFSGNPILSKGMSNPKFQMVLEEMQRNPKDAMKKYSSSNSSKDLEFVEFIREYCRVMGDHFTKLGELQEKGEKKKGNSVQTGKDENTFTPVSTKTKKNLGPLAESAMERNRTRPHKGNSRSKEVSPPLSQEEQAKVDNIVSNPELSELLMDPAFQHILQDSGDPRKFMEYARHPDYGPKIRKLIDAGVFQVQR